METTLAPLTTQLSDHIEFREEPILRKLITKDEKQQAVLVCIKAGTEIPEHTGNHDHFMTVISGQGTFTIDGRETVLEPGVFIALPARTPHATKAVTDLALLKIVENHECKNHPEPIVL